MTVNSDLTITRRIHFFRVSHAPEFLPLLPASLAAIQKLPWEEQGRYQPDATDNSLLSVMPHSFDYPLRLEFGRTRRDNLPEIERKGIKTTLSIAEDAGLIDVCHIVIFADGFVAAEFNRDAPRIRKLGDYLMFKGRNLSNVPRFQRLFERDLADVIRNMNNVRYLEIEIPPDNISLVRQAERSLADAFEAQQKVNKSRTLGLYFNARDPADDRLKSIGLALVQAMRGVDSQDAYEKLQIRGTDPHTRKPRTLNLLEDFLIAEVNFTRSSKKARSIDSAAAFAAIEDAYIQRREALEKSLRAVLPWD
ncbi:hypothetical protein [Sphingobium sp. CR28]|uniref:hypothetical protein n=1 Tax=Sphingobium sp. CR28 TaxID=3400272 RepID=UPI003FF0B02F